METIPNQKKIEAYEKYKKIILKSNALNVSSLKEVVHKDLAVPKELIEYAKSLEIKFSRDGKIEDEDDLINLIINDHIEITENKICILDYASIEIKNSENFPERLLKLVLEDDEDVLQSEIELFKSKNSKPSKEDRYKVLGEKMKLNTQSTQNTQNTQNAQNTQNTLGFSSMQNEFEDYIKMSICDNKGITDELIKSDVWKDDAFKITIRFLNELIYNGCNYPAG